MTKSAAIFNPIDWVVSLLVDAGLDRLAREQPWLARTLAVLGAILATVVLALVVAFVALALLDPR